VLSTTYAIAAPTIASGRTPPLRRVGSTACGRIHIDIHGFGGTPTP
jgi:hypothetical protein